VTERRTAPEPPDWALPGWDHVPDDDPPVVHTPRTLNLRPAGDTSEPVPALPVTPAPHALTAPGTLGVRILKVSEVTRTIRGAVRAEPRLSDLWVEGEIGRVTISTAGHAYFALKDDRSQLQCVWFRDDRQRSAFEPQAGLRIVAHGRIDLFEPQGALQLYVESIQPSGFGDLALRFEALKARLAAEGLFEAARKRPLPSRPRTIAVITSPSGAVWRDVCTVLSRRWPLTRVVLVAARVQGDGAPASIVTAFRRLDRWIAAAHDEGRPDDAPAVTILARGGGSLEDLWAFNDERVVRAVVGHRVPVVAGIGHEVDFTIADFVADLRAPTPSAAAELVVREKQAVVDSLGQLRARLERFAARPLRDLERRVDELTARLRRAMRTELGRANHRVALSTRALRASDPVARVARDRHRLENLQSRMTASLNRRRDRARYALETVVGRLDSLSPLAVLGRGYSLTRTATGEVVHSPAQVNTGDAIRVLLHRGSLDARVTDTREKDDRPQV